MDFCGCDLKARVENYANTITTHCATMRIAVRQQLTSTNTKMLQNTHLQNSKFVIFFQGEYWRVKNNNKNLFLSRCLNVWYLKCEWLFWVNVSFDCCVSSTLASVDASYYVCSCGCRHFKQCLCMQIVVVSQLTRR